MLYQQILSINFNFFCDLVSYFWRSFMVRPIIISGPSGGGKSTLLSRAFKEYPNTFAFSVSRKIFSIFFYNIFLKNIKTFEIKFRYDTKAKTW